MIAVDTNLLVYAHREESPFHLKARDSLIRIAEGPDLWAIPWPCLHEFLAIVTHPKIFRRPTTMPHAWEFLDAVLESPPLRLLSETHSYQLTIRELLGASRVVGPKVHDARIAALCLDNAVGVLWTADRDFSRFPTLRTFNPLVA
ncbi:MAG: type II toxin-antitoxin system VapC family toxin [Terrimicrobiaceae bacterium]